MIMDSYYLDMQEYRGVNVQYRVTEFDGVVREVEAIYFTGMRSHCAIEKTKELADVRIRKKIDDMLGPIEPEYAI